MPDNTYRKKEQLNPEDFEDAYETLLDELARPRPMIVPPYLKKFLEDLRNGVKEDK